MKQKNITKLNLPEEMALANLVPMPRDRIWIPNLSDWVKIIRKALRMTQKQLAKRANISQPQLANIEKGKGDPRLSTLQKVFSALSCNLSVELQKKSIEELLTVQARVMALRRLKQSAGSMALEKQAPEAEVFKHLLKKYTQEILQDPREKLWD